MMCPSHFLKIFETGPHDCLKEGLLRVISEAYVRWLTGRLQDVVITMVLSQMGLLLVVSPEASPWSKTWNIFTGTLVRLNIFW